MPEGASEPLKAFLSQCFEMDPSMRPSAEVLFEHVWLQEYLAECKTHKVRLPLVSPNFLNQAETEFTLSCSFDTSRASLSSSARVPSSRSNASEGRFLPLSVTRGLTPARRRRRTTTARRCTSPLASTFLVDSRLGTTGRVRCPFRLRSTLRRPFRWRWTTLCPGRTLSSRAPSASVSSPLRTSNPNPSTDVCFLDSCPVSGLPAARQEECSSVRGLHAHLPLNVRQGCTRDVRPRRPTHAHRSVPSLFASAYLQTTGGHWLTPRSFLFCARAAQRHSQSQQQLYSSSSAFPFPSTSTLPTDPNPSSTDLPSSSILSSSPIPWAISERFLAGLKRSRSPTPRLDGGGGGVRDPSPAGGGLKRFGFPSSSSGDRPPSRSEKERDRPGSSLSNYRPVSRQSRLSRTSRGAISRAPSSHTADEDRPASPSGQTEVMSVSQVLDLPEGLTESPSSTPGVGRTTFDVAAAGGGGVSRISTRSEGYGARSRRKESKDCVIS